MNEAGSPVCGVPVDPPDAGRTGQRSEPSTAAALALQASWQKPIRSYF